MNGGNKISRQVYFWKKMKVLGPLIIVIILTPVAFSDNLDAAGDAVYSLRTPDVAILVSDLNSTIISINIYDMQENEMKINDQVFQVLTIPGYGHTSAVGKPQLPVIRKIIGIPDNAKVTANVLHSSYSTQPGYMVYPFQPPEVDKDSGFVINETFYFHDSFYPKKLVKVEKPGIWRDLSVISLQVNPVMFNPATNELRVYHHIIIELQYSDGVSDEKTVFPMFACMYESAILNYNYLDVREAAKSCGYKYLAIANPFFVDEIQPLIDRHYSAGLKAFLVDTNTAGKTAEKIKNYITKFYWSNRNLEYVLLVGDIADVPWYTGWGVTGSDYWYGCICGNDLYPELAVGRITATTEDEVIQQVNKILKYENDPAPGDWVEKALLIAHKQGAPGKYEGCKEDIRTRSYADPFIFDTLYGSTGATNTDVNNKINAGVGIVDYRGHGSTTCWTGWTTAYPDSYCTQDAHALANDNMTPVIFSIACWNAHLSANIECLAEAFMKNDEAAVAFLGASEPSYTVANHEFDKQLFDAIGNEGVYSIGWVSNYANVKLIENYGANHPFMKNVKMYLWLGDPALEIWTAIPKVMNVTYPNNVSRGGKMTVTVMDDTDPIKNALVCVQNTGLYVTSTTDGNGMVTLSIPLSASEGIVDVTVTKHNYLPWEGHVEIKKVRDNHYSINKVVINEKQQNPLSFGLIKLLRQPVVKNLIDIFISLMEL